MSSLDTIAAIATPPGRGGVSIIRLSGPEAASIANTVFGSLPQPRYAAYGEFFDAENRVIDIGLMLYFPGPHSFTGEDVVEFQGHGGPVIMDQLLQRICQCGARIARPGEFSERAFLNDKIDLSQAEAIADLIDSSSAQAARAAVRSLQGEFSQTIHRLVEQLIHLRMYVEAAIDFPEEEIDFLSDGKVSTDLQNVINAVQSVKARAQQGAVLREGLTIVLAGHPNAGKSTLLNCLSGRESAIVTDIPGTTRDVMREHIVIDGIPLHIIDTAGLRDSDDVVEQEGIRRAWQAIESADHVLFIVDVEHQAYLQNLQQEFATRIPAHIPITQVINKIDNTSITARLDESQTPPQLFLSAKTGEGVERLRDHLKQVAGVSTTISEDNFIARRRHLHAIEQAESVLLIGQLQLSEHRAGELLAEDLRLAQQHLSEITGEFSADDLLGKIFSSFCIGK